MGGRSAPSVPLLGIQACGPWKMVAIWLFQSLLKGGERTPKEACFLKNVDEKCGIPTDRNTRLAVGGSVLTPALPGTIRMTLVKPLTLSRVHPAALQQRKN